MFNYFSLVSHLLFVDLIILLRIPKNKNCNSCYLPACVPISLPVFCLPVFLPTCLPIWSPAYVSPYFPEFQHSGCQYICPPTSSSSSYLSVTLLSHIPTYSRNNYTHIHLNQFLMVFLSEHLKSTSWISLIPVTLHSVPFINPGEPRQKESTTKLYRKYEMGNARKS